MVLLYHLCIWQSGKEVALSPFLLAFTFTVWAFLSGSDSGVYILSRTLQIKCFAPSPLWLCSDYCLKYKDYEVKTFVANISPNERCSQA